MRTAGTTGVSRLSKVSPGAVPWPPTPCPQLRPGPSMCFMPSIPPLGDMPGSPSSDQLPLADPLPSLSAPRVPGLADHQLQSPHLRVGVALISRLK